MPDKLRTGEILRRLTGTEAPIPRMIEEMNETTRQVINDAQQLLVEEAARTLMKHTMANNPNAPPPAQPLDELDVQIAQLTLIEDRLLALARAPVPSVIAIRQCAEDLRTARRAIDAYRRLPQ